MKTIGLIGGMSYESTTTYYEQINKLVNEKLGGLNSAKIVLTSVNFSEIELLQRQNRWDEAAAILSNQAKILQNAGCDFILICTNTMHKVYDLVTSSVKIPILHIAKAMLDELKRENVSKIGLLGTKYTMSENFYVSTLINGGVSVVLPSQSDMDFINSAIFNELCLGKKFQSTKQKFLQIISEFSQNNAQAVVLGCTEIGLLVSQNESKIRLFDTTLVHIKSAVNFALT